MLFNSLILVLTIPWSSTYQATNLIPGMIEGQRAHLALHWKILAMAERHQWEAPHLTPTYWSNFYQQILMLLIEFEANLFAP